ncbi:ATP-binding protein [Streptomyces luteolifulvus]|uniref:ATP-binding protein n=2 Tax=Streptomyces TaxID=1883 RepID=A0A6H9V467_9ACTN|nr:ATP-binding protein [Streptomyces luteolifulvus]
MGADRVHGPGNSSTAGTQKTGLASEENLMRTTRFAGELRNVTGARLAAEGFLRDLARAEPPAAPEYWDDILLVVTELAANAVQYAPGPFELRMRRTFDGVHVVMHDTSTTPPAPRPFHPKRGDGGIGWHLIHTLCHQVSVVTNDSGKEIHAFLPW